MPFVLPTYNPPDLNQSLFIKAPTVVFEEVRKPGVAPENYHATSIYPEYFHIRRGEWRLLTESRMDCVVVLEGDGSLVVKGFRHLKVGDRVACGRGFVPVED